MDTSVTTNFALPNCSSYQFNATTYGVVFDGNNIESSSLAAAEAVYEQIENQITNAYAVNTGNALTAMQFASTNELNSYVKERDYQDSPLCFSFGFDEFDSTTDTYTFDIQMYAGWIPLTRLNQDQYQQATYAVN